MKTREQKKRRILNLFPQHVIPDGLSLLSVYELVFYVLILAGCICIYRSWNKTPVIEKTIYVEDLSHTDKSASSFVCDYYIPNSVVFRDSTAHYYWTISQYDGSNLVAEHPVIDSLRNASLECSPLASSREWDPKFYAGFEHKQRGKWSNYSQKSKERNVKTDSLFNGGYIHTAYYLKNVEPLRVIEETYFGGMADLTHCADLNDKELRTPSFFSRRDISQAYYSFKVYSHSIDSIVIRFYFKGVVDFSPMGSSLPSYASGDLIEYTFLPDYRPRETDTRKWINKESADRFLAKEEYVSTIQFHVKTKDMENRQSQRVFLVTAVLSALVTIFLAFFIIFLYRIVKYGVNRVFKRKKCCEPEDTNPEKIE